MKVYIKSFMTKKERNEKAEQLRGRGWNIKDRPEFDTEVFWLEAEKETKREIKEFYIME